MDLRALSVKQPWAGLLMAGVKRFEVRRWAPSSAPLHVLVHASSGKARGLPALRDAPLFQQALEHAEMTNEHAWPASAFLGLVEFTRVWEPNELPDDVDDLDEFLCGTLEDVYLWEVGKRWVFDRPVPSGGKLNLWRPAETLYESLNSRLKQAGTSVQIG